MYSRKSTVGRSRRRLTIIPGVIVIVSCLFSVYSPWRHIREALEFVSEPWSRKRKAISDIVTASRRRRCRWSKWLSLRSCVFLGCSVYSECACMRRCSLIDGLREPHPKHKNFVFRVWASDKPIPVP